jgi:hypothetical protein
MHDFPAGTANWHQKMRNSANDGKSIAGGGCSQQARKMNNALSGSNFLIFQIGTKCCWIQIVATVTLRWPISAVVLHWHGVKWRQE